MNWIWVAMLLEAISEILQNCPEPEREKRRRNLFNLARKPNRLSNRMLLKAVRATPIGFDNDGPIYPRGREVVDLYKKVGEAITEMNDEELQEKVDIIDEIYEEDLEN